MAPRHRQTTGYIMFCVALLWACGETLYGSGVYRILGVMMLIAGALVIGGAVGDRLHARSKRRRSRVNDAGN